jgi:hypothetical protein
MGVDVDRCRILVACDGSHCEAHWSAEAHSIKACLDIVAARGWVVRGGENHYAYCPTCYAAMADDVVDCVAE